MNHLRTILVAVLASALFAFAAGTTPDSSKVETPPDTSKAAIAPGSSFHITHNHVFTLLGVLITHHGLRNSETLHNWPFFSIGAPALSSTTKLQKDFSKLLTVTGDANASLTPVNVGATLGTDLQLIHLLEAGVKGSVSSAWNYGRTSTFMGVYDPEERTFDQDIFMTEAAFSITYKAGLSIPLMMFLPKSDWTKIILKVGVSRETSTYTGASDGEPWKAGTDTRVNGDRGELSGTLMYILPFERLYMAMVTVKASRFMHEYEFDKIYWEYDPKFLMVGVTPTVMFKMMENWNGMVMVPIMRERKFNKRRYESNEELMLKRVGAEWHLNAVMCRVNYVF